MTQHVDIHITADIPEGDEFIGYAVVVAARDPADAVVKALEANHAINAKAVCRLIHKRPKLPIISGEATFRTVPRVADDDAA